MKPWRIMLLALLLAACTAPAEQGTELRFWVVGREGEVLVSSLLPEFEREHPDIRVRVQTLPWTAAHAKLLTAFASDALPDVFQLGNTWLPEFAAIGALAPLDTRLSASKTMWADDYFPGILDTNRIDGTLYGVPWNVDTRLLYYRTDVLAELGFDAPPQTWDEWRTMQAAIKRHVGPERYAVLLPLNEFEPQLALALQQDEPLLRDGGRYGNFRSDGFRSALGFYHEMFENAWAPKMTNTQIANVWVEFGRGFYAFYISGPWNIAEFRKRLPESLKDAWSTAMLPGPDGPGASIAGGSSMVLNVRGKNQDAAWTLIEFLSQPRIQRELNRQLGSLPSRRSSWDDPELAGDKYAQAFRAQLELVKPTPKVPEWEQIAQEIRVVSERLVAGEFDLDRAVEVLDARADQILEKRRWMLDRASEAAGAQ
jgi:multiple sugar transport system substrate-binding protein